MSNVITPQSVVSMIVNPNISQDLVFVEPGGVVRFSLDSATYTKFAIQFAGPSPAAAGSTLTGTIDHPAAVVFNLKEDVYSYNIVYHKADGKQKITGPFAVRSCRICG
jgi:hypothetical protein